MASKRRNMFYQNKKQETTEIGRWRILEFDYHWRALSYLLNLIDENSWSLDHVPIGETLTCLGELLPKDVLNHILDMYLESTGEFSDEGEELYSLARRKVSRFCGQVLLQAASLFNLDDFMNAWQQSVPQAITVDLSDLEGIALYDRDATPPVVWHCPESDLPEDVAERFDKLFDIRPKWTLQQISPYIRRLATGKQTVNALLTKFARCSNANSTKYYSSRHRK
ncbi:hypothetical protein AAG570_007376 [Ranatra chinensis]|uniref:Sister chromatid cohesion protein DCC1 n=1 Tax=Ranatra chinensis TaxID=642074 RepID=A0ABD0XVQ4_9HEMI